MSTAPDNLTPDTTRRADQPRPKTAADSVAKPDRADDLFDDTVAPHGKRTDNPMVVESMAPSSQADARMPTHVPLDHHDPFSDKPSGHPVGTTFGAATGAAAGAAAGAAIGATIGPVGAALGAAAGAIAAGFIGGAAGRRVSETIHPSTEDHYWRTHFSRRDYVPLGTPYETFRPAYLFGIRARLEHCEKCWPNAEAHLKEAWEKSPDSQRLPWARAWPAIRDAWDKLTPTDPDL